MVEVVRKKINTFRYLYYSAGKERLRIIYFYLDFSTNIIMSICLHAIDLQIYPWLFRSLFNETTILVIVITELLQQA